jgi:hypothetical protein
MSIIIGGCCMHVDIYITILVKVSFECAFKCFLRFSLIHTNYTPCQQTTSELRCFLENRNICGTYCEGCSQLLPNNISDGHCCFRERSKRSFLMRRHFQTSRQHFDALIRLCWAILAGADCRTSESLLLSMSYPSSLICFLL